MPVIRAVFGIFLDFLIVESLSLMILKGLLTSKLSSNVGCSEVLNKYK